MTVKQAAIQVIEKLPESASIEDIMEALYVRECVELGLADERAGRVVSEEDADRQIDEWLRH